MKREFHVYADTVVGFFIRVVVDFIAKHFMDADGAVCVRGHIAASFV